MMVTMRIQLRFIWSGLICLAALAPALRADVLEMQNGDRYSGKVITVTADTVVLNSEILGKINVPRSKVTTLTIGPGTSAAAPKPAVNPTPVAVTNHSIVVSGPAPASTGADLSALLRQLGGDTNFISGIRQQMVAGNPQAEGKFDELVNGLLSGQISLGDLRQQAHASANQIRELKRDLPEAADALDPYLQVLDTFLGETANEPAGGATKP